MKLLINLITNHLRVSNLSEHLLVKYISKL